MIHNAYPFLSFILSVIAAQVLKPFFAYFKGREFRPNLVFASGGMPSSHTAGVVGLCVSVGIQEGLKSPLFAITLAFAFVTAYDAANVRYYAGKNIKLTKQLIKDLRDNDDIELDEPIYDEPFKDVLGHRWSEVYVGGILGIIIAFLININFY